MTTPRHRPAEMMAEVASLFHLIGGMGSRHLTLIGGMAPPLLVPEAASSHRGSGDIDFSISVAFTKGETARYYHSLQEHLAPYFEPAEAGFRWRKREGAPGIPLLVDFMGPEIEATQVDDGTLVPEDDKAGENLGPTLRPLPLRAADVVDADAIIERMDGVHLVYKPGARASVDIRRTGPVGFLASKAEALDTRDESKDGYDLAWWCLNADPDPTVVAGQVIERDAFRHEYFPESVAILMRAFEAPDFVGPTGFAEEEIEDEGPGDQAFEEARNRAFLAMSKLLEALRASLWD